MWVGRDESKRQGLNLSGSWQQGHSELRFKVSRKVHPPYEVHQRHVPLGGPRPPTAGRHVNDRNTHRFCPDSDLETFIHNPTHGRFVPLAFQPSAMTNCGKTNLSHDGLNPAHVPYWWVNNPTLGEFCFTMIGRADIEGSKSNVTMNAWLPQASYPCDIFSDTSSFKYRRAKGSIDHISVLVELILGHLRYLLTDVPPQPNSQPNNVFRPDRPTKVGLGFKKRGSAPSPIHRISKITLKVVVFHFRCFQLPLIPHLSSQTNNLQVSIAAGLHQSFLWLRMLSFEPFTKDRGRSAVQPTRGSHQSASLRLTCFKKFRMGSPQADARSVHVPKHTESARAVAHNLDDDVCGTCSLSVYHQYLALDGIYRPIGAEFPNNLTRRQRLVVRLGTSTTRLSPSLAPLSKGLGPNLSLRTLLQTTIRTPRATDSHGGLIPRVAPPDLRSHHKRYKTHVVSWVTHPPSIMAHPTKVSIFNQPRDRAHGRPTYSPCRKYLFNRKLARGFDMGHPGRRAPNLMALGATCVQRLDGSWDSASHTKYRISLLSSSMQEPRYLFPRVILYNRWGLSFGTKEVALRHILLNQRQRTAHVAAIRTLHRTIQSVGAMGGVYKGQGRSQRELMTRTY
ncbi:senescence-associated protein, putative [Medicago truncatula]|uniref:Senescence-associated protein, putative n=1 Tax=Medicago truncatula TaxID=3880 RepID=A0A072TSK9_MEDTR|nr:senescence-associated protein, putative [Medicago truncatula]